MGAIDLPYPDAQGPALFTGVCLTAPTSPSDTLWMKIPSYGANDRQKVNWTPHGGSYPTIGTVGLLGRDEDDQLWLIMWIGPWS